MRIIALALMLCAGAFPANRTILAVGAHAGDMEISAGAVLARHARLGDRVVILHLSLGERGNPKMAPDIYGAQKRREAVAAARVMGAEVLFGPYKDGEVPRSEEAAHFVADVIRSVQPTDIITHWVNSIHRDHAATSQVVRDGALLASLDGIVAEHPPFRGVRGIYFAENWEDKDGFQPYIYVDVDNDIAKWKEAATQYEFIRGGISSFAYLDYYDALSRVRGAEAGRARAVAFDIEALGKKRVADRLP
jgi:N-acetylglucosamine malate deacetylase 1